MSDKIGILACFKYFLDCPKPYLIKTTNAKFAKENLAVDLIRVLSAENVFVQDVFRGPDFAKSNFAKNTNINIQLFSIGSWLSIKESFINMLLNFIEPRSSLIITDLICMLKSF